MPKLEPVKTARRAAGHRADAERDGTTEASRRAHLAAANRLEEQLRIDGRCLRCGRRLHNDKSVTDGIGPECRQKGT